MALAINHTTKQQRRSGHALRNVLIATGGIAAALVLAVGVLFATGTFRQVAQSIGIAATASGEPVIQVTAGTTVTWRNADEARHTVTLEKGGDSGLLANGQAFSHTFDAPGVYDYYCRPHLGMAGRVIVTAPEGQ
jgi:plastocyanin